MEDDPATPEDETGQYIIEGIKTTIPFHSQLMHNEDFLSGKYTTKFLDDFELKK